MNKSTGIVASVAIVCVLFLAGTRPPVPALDDGEAVYLTRCMSCHMVDGRGISGVFPPLVDTDWVTGDKGRLIRITLDGLSGPIDVQGMIYGGVMPPWKAFLSDKEVADVLTYIRTSFGNDAEAVTEQEVALVRNVTKERSTPWTADDFVDAVNQGIPDSQ